MLRLKASSQYAILPIDEMIGCIFSPERKKRKKMNVIGYRLERFRSKRRQLLLYVSRIHLRVTTVKRKLHVIIRQDAVFVPIKIIFSRCEKEIEF